jgi:S-DNA-T family DNA segregation ATPase FtsK/SpoIIIE
LAKVRTRWRDAVRAEAAHAALLHPTPSTLGGALRPGAADTFRVRVGTGPVRTRGRVVMADVAEDADPLSVHAALRLVEADAQLDPMPVTIELADAGSIAFDDDEGNADAHSPARACLRAVVAQAAAGWDPSALRIEVRAGPDAAATWDWVKWLPHAHVERAGRSLVVVDGGPRPAERDANRTVLTIGGEADRVFEVRAGRLAERGVDVASADRLSLAEAAVLARRLARRHGARPSGRATTGEFCDLLGIADLEAHLAAPSWIGRDSAGFLRVPVGLGEDGTIELDLKEGALGGSGPHGLLVGATGSGKSELLRALVAALALRHPPSAVNFLLIDFKGGAAFAELGALPHTAGLITNLGEDEHLVGRMQAALHGELARRQRLLRDADNAASVYEYDQVRDRLGLPALPSLLVVIDEFSEFLAAHPDFAETLVAIGRLGRSLGLHLLLASQRVDEGRLRGLESHLSYRIGLRTFSAVESRAVLGVPDAFGLPVEPGVGLLRDVTGALLRFRGAHVSAALPWPQVTVRNEVQHFRPPEPVRTESRAGGPSVLATLVAGLAGATPTARQIWIPPLGPSPTLGEILGPVPELPARRASPPLAAAIGVLDRPFEQRHEQHVVDLRAAHIAVAGRPQSGKSSLLVTLVAALSHGHRADEAQFYCIDMGAGGLAALGDLPQVGAVVRGAEAERVARVFAMLVDLIDERTALGAQLRLDSVAGFRQFAAGEETPDNDRADVFLVIDGVAAFRESYPDLEAALLRIAAQGLAVGVHLVLSCQRWAELRPALRDLVAERIELRLGDPVESLAERRMAAAVPENRPGRGVVNGAQFLSALPYLDDGSSGSVTGVAALVRAVVGQHRGAPAPRLQLLPEHIGWSELPVPDRPGSLAIGVGGPRVTPVWLDVARQPHFVVIGERESGKSTAIRSVLRAIATAWPPQQARIVLAHARGAPDADLDLPQLAARVRSGPELRQACNEIAVAMARRQSDDRSSTHPRLFLVIDDYELLTSTSPHPLAELATLLPRGSDLGLHLILSRSCGGMQLSHADPALRTLRDLGATCLLLSGRSADGPVWAGVRMRPSSPGRGLLVDGRGDTELVQVAC